MGCFDGACDECGEGSGLELLRHVPKRDQIPINILEIQLFNPLRPVFQERVFMVAQDIDGVGFTNGDL